MSMDTGNSRFAISLGVLMFSGAVFIRMAVSLHPYSGAGKAPLFGDYEAQRHWMEITYNLPVGEWYVNSTSNDLLYWGLDYPPLTAYHSWLCGAVAHRLNPDWVALNASRGYESYEHKLFMRYTVIVVDVLVYFTAAFSYCWVVHGRASVQAIISLLFLLLQPCLVLIDHGHFQYNCISLGLALWGIIGVITQHDILGAIAFTLALNYKQMELYHALPFFFFLLGKALQSKRRTWKIASLGVTVIATFVICWSPFLTNIPLTLQVLRRLFPFARGLYEDKVANFWCSVAVVIKLRQLFSQVFLLRFSLVTTLLAVLPSSWNLLRYPTPDRFILALVNSSLAFFLFSFQVHEKTILLASLPASLLLTTSPTTTWFTLIATFSMYPLLVKDGLALACWALCGLFYVLSQLLPPATEQKPHWTSRTMFTISMTTMLLLCGLSHLLPPPPTLPDIFPVLISGYSCVHFLLFFVYFHWLQFTASPTKPDGLKPHTD